MRTRLSSSVGYLLLIVVFPVFFLSFGIFVVAQTANQTVLNNTNYCTVYENGLQKFICNYIAKEGTVDDGTELDESEIFYQGKTIQLTNKSGQNLFVPNKTEQELAAFARAAKETVDSAAYTGFGQGVEVCVTDTAPLKVYDFSGSEVFIEKCEGCSPSCSGNWTTSNNYCSGIWQTSTWQPVYTGNSCASWAANGGSLSGDASCNQGAASGHFCQGNDKLYACHQVVTNHFCSGASTASSCTSQNAACTWHTGVVNHTCVAVTDELACSGQNAACTWNSCGYRWKTGKWGTCILGEQTRSLSCIDADNNTVENVYCEGLAKPSILQPCGSMGSGSGATGGLLWQCYHNGEDGVYQPTATACSGETATQDKINGDNCYLDAYQARTHSLCCLPDDSPIVDVCGESTTSGGASSGGSSGGGGGSSSEDCNPIHENCGHTDGGGKLN